jgi:hypothetical protein
MRKANWLVLMLVMTIMAAACSTTKTTSLPAAVDQHLAWIPQAVNGVAYCDMQSLRQSELGQALEKDFSEHLNEMRRDRLFKEMLERAGFDIEKDLHSVLIGFEGGERDGEQNFAFVATGNFDEQKIIKTVKAVRDSMEKHHGERQGSQLTAETYNGKTIYVIDERGGKAFYFADANTFVAGDKEWVQSIIDGKTAEQSVKQNAAVTGLMNKLRFKDQCWVVANTANVMEKVAEELGESRDFKGTRAVKAVQGVTFSAHLGQKAELYGEAVCDSEENSKLLVEAAKGVLATAKLAVSDDREAVDMLNRIDIDLAGSAVKFTADLDKAFFNKMREKAEGRHKPVAMQ